MPKKHQKKCGIIYYDRDVFNEDRMFRIQSNQKLIN
jgi:hypothetical protein